MQKKDTPLSNQKHAKPPSKPEKPSNGWKNIVDDKNKKPEPKKNELKTTDVVKNMIQSEKVEVEAALEKAATILENSVVELTAVIESSIAENQIEKVEKVEKEEVLEKQSTISEKLLNMFFSSKKNEQVSNDDAPVTNIRDDIEDVIPVKEDMIRDEVMPFIELTDEDVYSEKESIVEPLIDALASSIVEQGKSIVEPLVNELVESLEELKEKVDLPSLEKPLTTEIDIKLKLKTSYFFCCYM